MPQALGLKTRQRAEGDSPIEPLRLHDASTVSNGPGNGAEKQPLNAEAPAPSPSLEDVACEREIDSKLLRWHDVRIGDIPQVPGMTQEDELKYFYWCCATQHRPGRRVVELGPYVGRSTMALAAGLRRSADPRGKLVSVDCFRWNRWALDNTLDYTIRGLSSSQRARLTRKQLHPQENDTFLPLFQLLTEPLQDSIEAVDAELERYEWCGEPIDVLMVDAAKSWDTLDQIVRQFFPCLADGAVVIHQDYKHFFTYWLHIVTERMLERGLVTIAESVDGCPTQGFRFHKPTDFCIEEFLSSAFSNAESEELLARSVDRFRGEHERLAVLGAKCRFLIDQGQTGRAKHVFERAFCDGGFADNYALADLLAIGHEWNRPLTATLLETAVAQHANSAAKLKLRPAGPHSIAVPLNSGSEPTYINALALDTAGCSQLTMNFWANTSSDEALRIRFQAVDAKSRTPFFDETYQIAPGAYQPVLVPLDGRASITLQWAVDAEGQPKAPREICLIAPILLTNAAA